MSSLKIKIDKTSILIFILLYFSNVTLIFGSNADTNLVTASRYFSLIVSLFLLFDCIIRKKISVNNSLFLFLLIATSGLNVFLQKSSPQIFFVQSVFILLAYFISCEFEIDYISQCFCKVMYFLCFSSIVIEILSLTGLNNVFPVVTNTGGIKYNWMILGNVSASSGILKRNMSIFWEPGTFSIYIILALFLVIFMENSIDKRKYIIVYILSEILTFSTTGYICLLIVFALYFVNNSTQSKGKQRAGVILLVTLLVLGVFGEDIISIVFTNKLSGLFSGNITDGSYISRYSSIVGNFRILMDQPLLGCGYSNINRLFVQNTISLFSYDLRTTANANTIMYKYAVNGIVYGSIILVGASRAFIKTYNAKGIRKIFAAIFLFVLFSGENLQHSALIYIIMFYGFKKENNSY